MKKNFLMIAPAAAAVVLALGMTCTFTSCSNEDIAQVEDEEIAISFDEYINKATKAEIVDEQALANAGGFSVWGYKTKTTGLNWSAKTTIFNEVTVSGTDAANPVWSYSDTKYWDKTCTYKFFAAGPAGASGLSIIDDATNIKKFQVTGAASALASSSTSDIVIDRVPNTKNAATVTAGYKESFDFHHIMAKVSFKVKKSDDLKDADVLVLKNMKMTGWNANTGTFTQAKFDGTYTALNISEWSQTAGTAGETAELVDEDKTLTKTAAELTGKAYIMVPQTIAASTLKFTVTYTLNGETFSDQEATLTAAQTWGTDSHTVYTIAIGPQAIVFDVTSVCDFCYNAPGQAVAID